MNNDAKSIVINYEDGSTKEILKGIAAEFNGDNMSMNMVNFEKFDLVRLAYGMIVTVEKMGLERELREFMEEMEVDE